MVERAFKDNSKYQTDHYQKKSLNDSLELKETTKKLQLKKDENEVEVKRDYNSEAEGLMDSESSKQLKMLAEKLSNSESSDSCSVSDGMSDLSDIKEPVIGEGDNKNDPSDIMQDLAIGINEEDSPDILEHGFRLPQHLYGSLDVKGCFSSKLSAILEVSSNEMADFEAESESDAIL